MRNPIIGFLVKLINEFTSRISSCMDEKLTETFLEYGFQYLVEKNGVFAFEYPCSFTIHGIDGNCIIKINEVIVEPNILMRDSIRMINRRSYGRSYCKSYNRSDEEYDDACDATTDATYEASYEDHISLSNLCLSEIFNIISNNIISYINILDIKYKNPVKKDYFEFRIRLGQNFNLIISTKSNFEILISYKNKTYIIENETCLFSTLTKMKNNDFSENTKSISDMNTGFMKICAHEVECYYKRQESEKRKINLAKAERISAKKSEKIARTLEKKLEWESYSSSKNKKVYEELSCMIGLSLLIEES